VWQAKMQNKADLFGANAILGLAGAVNETLFQVTVCNLPPVTIHILALV
jgi:hypothetical protein